MGREKPKDPQTDAVSSQTDTFKTLFGDAATDAVPSIFSDDNPFRKKDRGPGFGSSAPSLESCDDAKKRKRSKETTLVAAADEAPTERKKSKKEKPNPENPSLNNGSSGKDGDVVSNLVLGLGLESANQVSDYMQRKGVEVVVGVENKERKKRKRDELETKYEAKKYGVKENKNHVVGEKRKTVDDMLVSNEEGFDDEDKLLRTVFVGNLPLKAKKKVLIKEFTKFGEVESVRLRSVPIKLDSKKSRKGAICTKEFHEVADSTNAYIVFKTEESAHASLSHNMAVVEGHHIRVDRACPPRKKLKGENATVYDHRRTIFVGNLPFDVKDEEVYQLFCGVNNLSGVEAVRIIRDANLGIGKGIGYVLFKTKEAANAVVRKRNLKLRDRELRLSYAKPESASSNRKDQDSTPSKRSNPSPASNAKSPGKRQAVGSRTPEFKKGNSNSSTSYQGIRAGKPGVQKKGPKPKFESRPHSGVKPAKAFSEKRPSVAARKAKAAFQGATASKQGGMKRKMDKRTPDSSHQNKKFKKFK